MLNTILAKRVNHIVAKRDNPDWPKGSKLRGFSSYNREGGTVVVTKRHNRDMMRRPKPWFDPVIEDHIPALEKIVIDYCGELFINTTRILINR